MTREDQSGVLLLAALSMAGSLALAVVFTPSKEKAPPAPSANTDVRLVRTIAITRWALWCERVGGNECHR